MMKKVLFLLSHLDDNDLDWIVEYGERQKIDAGFTIIEKGQPIDAMYIILDGSVEVLGATLDGKAIRIGCGEVIGEVSMLDPRPPMATVVAETDVIVLALPIDILNDKLQSDEMFASHFYHSLAMLLAHRLRNTIQKLAFNSEDEVLNGDEEYEDELNPDMLDTVHLMGNRFNRLLKLALSD